METNNKSTSWITVCKLAGAFVAFCIGSGFATGQEILQFFTAYGWGAYGAVLLSFSIYLCMTFAFMPKGQDLSDHEIHNIFAYYFGDKIGKAFDWFSIFFCYCVVVVLLSGAGAISSEYYNFSHIAGAAIMALVCLVVVVFGIMKVVDVIGFIGPLIIVFTCVVCTYALVTNLDQLPNVSTMMETVNFPKAASSWWLSGLLYPCFMVFMLAPFLPQAGSVAKNKKETILGGFVGVLGFHIAIAVAVLAMLVNATFLDGKLIPLLALAQESSPHIASAFAIIILAGIFTSACPLLYTCTRKFFDEKTVKFKILAIFFTVFGVFSGLFLPFDKLVNIIYSFLGYLGIITFVCIMAKEMMLRKK